MSPRTIVFSIAAAVFIAALSPAAHADILLIGGSLNNGNLDRTHAEEIVPGFFLPKPNVWQRVETRGISGTYNDGLISEPWAGPAPTPVTTDGNLNPPHPEGTGGPDGGIFFKPFTGSNLANGPATAHLYQNHPATPGLAYTFTGWAGAEANAQMVGAEFAIEFYNAGNVLISAAVLDLKAAGLFVPNGEPFNYKQRSVIAIAPNDAASLRVRASMIDGTANPAGGGQAFVVDDFTLSVVPEPASLAALAPLLLAATRRRRRG